MWDPYIDESWEEIKHKYDDVDEPQIYFIGTKHPEFVDFPFEKGSVVLDPWRYIPKRDDIDVIHIGDSLL